MADEKTKKTPKKDAQQKPQKSAQQKPSKKAPEKPDVQQSAPETKVKKELKPKVPSALEKKYNEECVPHLMKQFGYKNRMEAPKLSKIVINLSIKEALQDVKILENAANEIAAISGQKPALKKAKKSIANFKLRKGQAIGAMVTLRKKSMYEFLNRLVNVALPRVRDFKGVSAKSFDGRGNYTLGLTEQIIFPEINFDKVSKVTGMNVTFVTTARKDEEGRALLGLMGMPFKTT